MAAPVSALEICIHKLKSDFIHSGAAQQYLPANVAHSHIDVHIRIRSDAQHVFLCAHAATEAYLAYCKRGLTPGTGDCRRNGFFQHDPFVTPLPYPWTSWSRIQRSNRQFPRLKTAIGHDLGGIAWINLSQRLSRCDPQFAMMLPLEHSLRFKKIFQDGHSIGFAQSS